MFIYPRKRMIAALLNGAPPQSVGYTSATGWTDSNLFINWLEHFVRFTNASKSSPHIIILDGHHSHKTLSAITFARDNGLHLLTLPPHCTHRMQPLDRSYFKSLKSGYNTASDGWMVAHPGKRISFYDMAGIFGTAFLRTTMPDKAIQGFKCTGLWPFDPTVFTDDDFTAAVVTEEAQPVTPAVADLQPVAAGTPPPPVSDADLQPVAALSDVPPSVQLNVEEQGRGLTY